MHRPLTALTPTGRTLERLMAATRLAGRKVPIVDDDIRNIFAMTTVLEGCQMSGHLRREQGSDREARHARRGNRADGHHDAGHGWLRHDPRDSPDSDRSSSWPIVAVTAKAMKGDREKCIEAGRGTTSLPVIANSCRRSSAAGLHR